MFCSLYFESLVPKAKDPRTRIKEPRPNTVSPKEIATHYNAKVFDTPESAQDAGFVLAETAAPRNVWNKASAASAIVLKLVEKRASGEATEIGLVIEPWRITGCYKTTSSEPTAT